MTARDQKPTSRFIAAFVSIGKPVLFSSSLIHSAFLGILLLMSVNSVWAEDGGGSTEVLKEYYRLLNATNEGTVDDTIALFLHTAEHSDELGKYGATVLTLLLEASNQGHGEASYWVGYLAQNGMWIDSSEDGALVYNVLSAQQGFDKAMLWCVLHFSTIARETESEENRAKALNNADKWYNKLASQQESSNDYFRRARFVYATARLDASITDEFGWTLMGEAALDGHTQAISIIRELYAQAISDEQKGDDFAAKFVALTQPVIDVIGLTD